MRTQVLPRVEVGERGAPVAWADAIVRADDDGQVRLLVNVSVPAGRHPTGSHGELMARMLENAARVQARRMTVSLPAADFEAIDVLHHKSRAATTHLAGSTCIVELELDPQRR